MFEKPNLQTAIISANSSNQFATELVAKQRFARQYFYESQNEKANKRKILLISGLLAITKE